MMTMPALSKGSIRGINASSWDESRPPLLQILDVKQVPQDPPNGGASRFRLVLSDGGTYQEAIAASKAAEMFSGGVFKRFSIVRLTSWVMAPINNLNVLIALKMELVDEGPGSAIGNVHTLGNADSFHKQRQLHAALHTSGTTGDLQHTSNLHQLLVRLSALEQKFSFNQVQTKRLNDLCYEQQLRHQRMETWMNQMNQRLQQLMVCLEEKSKTLGKQLSKSQSQKKANDKELVKGLVEEARMLIGRVNLDTSED